MLPVGQGLRWLEAGSRVVQHLRLKRLKMPRKNQIPQVIAEAEMEQKDESKKRDIRELGRLLRLVGPLLQIPSLWALTQRPEWASHHMAWIYGGFASGFVLVSIGLVMHLVGRR